MLDNDFQHVLIETDHTTSHSQCNIPFCADVRYLEIDRVSSTQACRVPVSTDVDLAGLPAAAEIN